MKVLLVLTSGDGGASVEVSDRRLAALLVVLATKGARWHLDGELKGKVHLSFDGDGPVRCWRELDEAPMRVPSGGASTK